MPSDKTTALREALFEDLQGFEDITNSKPMLAHYTSIQTIELILKNDELWLSHPLNMNDHQELIGGLSFAMRAINECKDLYEAFEKAEQYHLFLSEFQGWQNSYGENDAFDLYVACFSRHNVAQPDGRLAMWRGYGDYGNGAAIVIDSSKLQPVEENPLVLAAVNYGTDEDRYQWCQEKVRAVADHILRFGLADTDIREAAYYVFQRFLLFSLFSKHIGFSEEEEWRVVYMKDRDTDRLFTPMFGYAHGRFGLEPKLKLKLDGKTPHFPSDFRLEDIIHSIIIGPRASSPLSRYATRRMLEQIGKGGLREHVHTSTIPFRE
jgi:hypothetical protein